MEGVEKGPNAVKLTYRPLDKAHDIRLVELLPAPDRDDEIRCHILHSFLTDEARTCPISDGCQLDITPNLHAALRSLRTTSRSRILWVDQICINQQDLAERSAQVCIMHSVYQQATQAIVWLGKADATSSVAADFLILLDEKFVLWESRKPGRAISFADLGKHGLPKKEDIRWTYLGALLARPWFYRTWVLQEITVVNFISRLCNNPALEQHIANLSGPYPHGIFTATRIQYIQSRMPLSSISELLYLTNRQMVTDVQDKVYAIMGFLKEEIRLIPNYALPVEQLFLELAQNAIRAGDMSILRYTSPLSTKRSLPSWAPDWSMNFNDIPEPIHQAVRDFTASGDSKAVLVWSETKNLLGVRAILVDTIDQNLETLLPFPADLGNPWYGSLEAKDEWARRMGVFIGSALNLASRCLPNLKAAAAEERFWRTLIMDCIGNGTVANEGFGRYFEIFFRDLKWHWIFDYDPLAWLRSPILAMEAVSMLLRRRHHQDGVTTFIGALIPAAAGRAFVLTTDKRIGWVSTGCQAGDQVALIYGCPTPFIVRRCG